jgi:hypothetical protein
MNTAPNLTFFLRQLKSVGRYWRKVTSYLITLSARASTLGGIVRPISLAALRLMISSNFVACSTGRSAGLSAFQNLLDISNFRRHEFVSVSGAFRLRADCEHRVADIL